jgi:hypothetical protein
MKTNIYQKLHTAACQASGVVKGKKVPGMQFNPLLHDEVQRVAMEALLNNGLYPVCNYTNTIHENFIVVTCSMRIHDIENPDSYVDVNGCSAMGNLDKFGTGNGMSYAKKYAYLNALHLKTGLDNEDGYNAKPFNKIPQSSGTKHDNDHVMVIDHIKNDIKNAKTIYELRKLRNYKYKDAFNIAMKNHLRVYRQLDDLYGTKETQLNTQGVTQ